METGGKRGASEPLISSLPGQASVRPCGLRPWQPMGTGCPDGDGSRKQRLASSGRAAKGRSVRCHGRAHTQPSARQRRAVQTGHRLLSREHAEGTNGIRARPQNQEGPYFQSLRTSAVEAIRGQARSPHRDGTVPEISAATG